MKRRNRLLASAIFCATLFAMPLEAMAAQKLKTTIDLKYRTGASSSKAVIGIIPKGTEIPVLTTTGNWGKTEYRSMSGYALLHYMAPSSATVMTMVTIDLRLRSGPSTLDNTLATIPKTTPVPLLEQQGSWIKTIWSGKVGWIGSKYTKPVAMLPVMKTTSSLRLRTGPGTGYATIKLMPKGTVLPVLAVSGKWVKTWLEGRIGWMSKAYLQSSAAESTPAPSIGASRPAALPDEILAYPNTSLAWSHAYPQDTGYGYPQFDSHYRYSDGKVHLTLDNGYENGLTTKYLDILKEKNVKTTFYVTGYYLKTEPELVRRMLAEGHVVGNHSDAHPDTPQLMEKSSLLVYEDLIRWETLYKNLTGSQPKKWLYRAPSGVFSQRLLAMVQWMGYQTEFYEVALNDWDTERQLPEEVTMASLMNLTKPGSIVLLHSVSSSNLAVLGDYIDAIRAKGWEFADPQSN